MHAKTLACRGLRVGPSKCLKTHDKHIAWEDLLKALVPSLTFHLPLIPCALWPSDLLEFSFRSSQFQWGAFYKPTYQFIYRYRFTALRLITLRAEVITQLNLERVDPIIARTKKLEFIPFRPIPVFVLQEEQHQKTIGNTTLFQTGLIPKISKFQKLIPDKHFPNPFLVRVARLV